LYFFKTEQSFNVRSWQYAMVTEVKMRNVVMNIL
jgi:hypothetical protein